MFGHSQIHVIADHNQIVEFFHSFKISLITIPRHGCLNPSKPRVFCLNLGTQLCYNKVIILPVSYTTQLFIVIILRNFLRKWYVHVTMRSRNESFFSTKQLSTEFRKNQKVKHLLLKSKSKLEIFTNLYVIR